jgi:hypothetical protein
LSFLNKFVNLIFRQTDKLTDKQTKWLTNRQTDKMTNWLTDTPSSSKTVNEVRARKLEGKSDEHCFSFTFSRHELKLCLSVCLSDYNSTLFSLSVCFLLFPFFYLLFCIYEWIFIDCLLCFYLAILSFFCLLLSVRNVYLSFLSLCHFLCFLSKVS